MTKFGGSQLALTGDRFQAGQWKTLKSFLFSGYSKKTTDAGVTISGVNVVKNGSRLKVSFRVPYFFMISDVFNKVGGRGEVFRSYSIKKETILY